MPESIVITVSLILAVLIVSFAIVAVMEWDSLLAILAIIAAILATPLIRWEYVATAKDRVYTVIKEVPIQTVTMPDGSQIQIAQYDPLTIVNLTEKSHSIYPPGSTCFIKRLDHHSHGINLSGEADLFYTPHIPGN